jgi:hypothetical protein
MCEEADLLTIFNTEVPHCFSIETDVFESWLCFIFRQKNKTYTYFPFDGPSMWPMLASFLTHLFLMLETVLASKIVCLKENEVMEDVKYMSL